MSAVRWLVGNMHVGTPDVDVIRELYRRCRRALDGRRHRRARRKIYREGLKAHHANQQLCRDFRL